MATLFSRIIHGEIPSYRIYEDAYVYAFLDICPQQPGHILLVPKIEVDHFLELPEPYYSHLCMVAKTIAQAVQKATLCHRVCTAFIGYEIPHCHYHIIPTNSIEESRFIKKPPATPEELLDMQSKIIVALNS